MQNNDYVHTQKTVWKIPKFLKATFLLAIILLPVETFAQSNSSIVINGKVIDGESGQPIYGASVIVKKGSSSTQTDENGAFSLNSSQNFPVLIVVSFIGYNTKEILVEKNNVEVILAFNPSQLEDVVVVGYGTQQRNEITGAVGTLKMNQEISGRPSTEIGQALYGKIPGVQVLSSSGRPGASSSIQIRGINSVSASSTPLIVIDGMPIPNYDLNQLNTADVQSIEILKDAASAAIYGSRGANGVILVTTKSGIEGRNSFNVNYSYGTQTPIDKIDVMNSAEYAAAAIDAAQNGWVESGGDPNAPNTIEARGQYKYTWPRELETPENLFDTDWQDVIFRTAPLQKIDVNASGGNSKTNYLVSAGYTKQDGIVITSDYNKYTLNTKVNSEVKDWLTIGGSINISGDQEREPYNRITEWAVQYPSIYPVYGNNGLLGAPTNTPGFENYDAILFRPKNGHPLYQINDNIQHRQFNSIANFYGQIKLLKGLNFKTSLNVLNNRADHSNYQAIDHGLGPSFYTEGIMTVEQARTANYTSQNLLTYDTKILDHSFSALLGFEYNNIDYYYTNQERRGYDNDLVQALSAGRTVFEAKDDHAKTILISYFARLNYNYQGKYLLAASIRRDGSSRFGPDNKWGYFPSISAGWVASNEEFLADNSIINDLRFRVSYGQTGNDRFADYKWIGAMNQGRVAFGNNLGTSYYPGTITNPALEWEKTSQFNIGFNLGLFSNRVNLEMDYYVSKSDALLLDVPLPSLSGFTSIFKNIGSLENKGFELGITTYNVQKAFQWNTQFNISRNTNKLTSLGPDNAPMVYNPGFGMESINQVGSPIFSFFGYKYLGVYKNQAEIDADPSHYETARPGDGRYADINGDNQLNAEYRTIIGNYSPDFIWGITNNFSYKDFDLSFLFQGVHGSDVFDNNIHRSMLYHEGRNYYKELEGRWRSEENPGDGYHYKLSVDLDGYEKTASSYWIVDGTYFRIKSLTAGYTFNNLAISSLNLQSLRIYFNGLNLFTKKNSPIFDPENFNGSETDATKRGVSHSPYPTAKVFTFGINVGF